MEKSPGRCRNSAAQDQGPGGRAPVPPRPASAAPGSRWDGSPAEAPRANRGERPSRCRERRPRGTNPADGLQTAGRAALRRPGPGSDTGPPHQPRRGGISGRTVPGVDSAAGASGPTVREAKGPPAASPSAGTACLEGKESAAQGRRTGGRAGTGDWGWAWAPACPAPGVPRPARPRPGPAPRRSSSPQTGAGVAEPPLPPARPHRPSCPAAASGFRARRFRGARARLSRVCRLAGRSRGCAGCDARGGGVTRTGGGVTPG